QIDLSEWKNGVKKVDSRIFFQLVLKAEAFPYIKNINPLELKARLFAYVEEKSKIHVINESEEDRNLNKLKDFLFLNRYTKKEKLSSLADALSSALTIENPEVMAKALVSLNEVGVFDKIGVGFLISLLPEEKLKELVYLKLEMIGKDIRPINAEMGSLNYRVLYDELAQVQSRISNRGYDLRITNEDRNMEETQVDKLNN
ncbi:MAG: hypothetical protein Q7U04_12325, partial [Bacteriovorax sp.]|nr:hypothetical protein [Bacteriovorax sp.]